MVRCPSCYTESPDDTTLCPVWLAEDIQLNNEPVACKILKPELYDDHRAVSDLKREVLLTRRLRHPNILGVYTFWETSAT